MFKTIVLAPDGSEESQQAVPLPAELARQDGARIVIAHVQENVVDGADADLIVVGTRGHSAVRL